MTLRITLIWLFDIFHTQPDPVPNLITCDHHGVGPLQEEAFPFQFYTSLLPNKVLS